MRLLRAFVFCMFLMGSCSPVSSPTTFSPTVISSVTDSVPTDPPTTPTAFPLETVTKPSGPVSEIPSCINMQAQEVITAEYQISGVMLSLDRPPYSSSGRADYQESSLYHFDLATRVERFLVQPEDYQDKIKTKIMRIGVQDLSVSPDFRRAIYLVDAYVESNWEPRKSWLEIYDSSSKERINIPWKDEWEYIVGWTNNDLFAIRSGGSLLLFDSEGHIKEQLLSSKLPDYANPRTHNPDIFLLWGGYRKIGVYSLNSFGMNLESVFSDRTMKRLYNPTLEIYSPTLENVIYTEVADGESGVVLYNTQENRKVIEIITGNSIEPKTFGGSPVWSPDGNHAVMLLPTSQNIYTEQNLFLLGIDGSVKKLVAFDVLGPYSWSPDGKYVAFWLAEAKGIGILNIENEDLRVFCITGDYSNGGFGSSNDFWASGDLVWLPNNNQILVEVEKQVDDVRYEGIAVADLEKSIFIQLKWNARYPVWLNE